MVLVHGYLERFVTTSGNWATNLAVTALFEKCDDLGWDGSMACFEMVTQCPLRFESDRKAALPPNDANGMDRPRSRPRWL
jgi:hypothetical protein